MNEINSDTSRTAGACLRAAREAAGLRVEDVAVKLRLASRQVQALEADDLAALPGVTVVRGFIRNYAALLGLEATPLLQAMPREADVRKQALAPEFHSIPAPAPWWKERRTYVLGLLVLALAGGLIYRSTVSIPHENTPPPASLAPVVDSPVVAPAAAPEVPAPSPASGAAAPVSDPIRVRLVFSDRVWISITDHAGREIHRKEHSGDSEEVVEGTPPLKLWIGNAAGVRIIHGEREVDLAPHTHANTARVTLEATP